MSNKTELKKEVTSKTGANKNEKQVPVRVPRKTKKLLHKSSVAEINAVQGSAVGAVKANSSRTMRASSDIADTGTIISYD